MPLIKCLRIYINNESEVKVVIIGIKQNIEGGEEEQAVK